MKYGSQETPLKDLIEQFQREIGNAVDNLDQINSLSRKLLELPVERLGRELEFISELLDEAKQTVRKASAHLFEGIEGWGETSFSTITSTNSNASSAPMSSGSTINPTVSPVVVNTQGQTYPTVVDSRNSKPIHFPQGNLAKIPKEQRVVWGRQERGQYIAEWIDRKYSVPEGGWASYDIHHIHPRELGGNNDFDNLVPVLREVHQSEFNEFWRNW
jgi:hypothetical protein